jgi:hypothetical protein
MSDKTPKLHILLALREKGEVVYKNGISDLVAKFKNKQGIFKGARRTYEATPGFSDDPTKRGLVLVESTIKEQFDYFLGVNKEHLNNVFAIERTNSGGGAVAELIVAGTSFGTYSSLELLRLKSMLEDSKLKEMIQDIPIRSEAINWSKSSEDLYKDKEIFETEMESFIARTTQKETYIVNDPHVKDAPNRAPIVAEKSTVVEMGHGTSQFFSGEYSLRERAYMIARLNTIHTAVIAALEKANDAEIQPSDLGEKAIQFLFTK